MTNIRPNSKQRDELVTAIKNVSSLITDVDFCSCSYRIPPCRNTSIYIRHAGSTSSAYHCTHISNKGLMVNSNGYHPIEVHDAMNEAVRLAKAFLDEEKERYRIEY